MVNKQGNKNKAKINAALWLNWSCGYWILNGLERECRHATTAWSLVLRDRRERNGITEPSYNKLQIDIRPTHRVLMLSTPHSVHWMLNTRSAHTVRVRTTGKSAPTDPARFRKEAMCTYNTACKQRERAADYCSNLVWKSIDGAHRFRSSRCSAVAAARWFINNVLNSRPSWASRLIERAWEDKPVLGYSHHSTAA